MGYAAKVYKDKGGDRLVVAAGGEIDQSAIVRLLDDFLGDVLADPWNGRVGTNPQCVAPAISVQIGGAVRLITGDDAAADMATNGVQLESVLNWKASQGDLIFEARLKVDDITAVAIFAGLTDQAAALELPFELGAGDALTSNAGDAVGFLFDTGADTDKIWFVGVKADVDAAKQNSAVAPVNATFITLRVEVSSAGVATFFINGVPVGMAMADAITPGAALTPVIAACARGAASRTIDVDYVRLQQDR